MVKGKWRSDLMAKFTEMEIFFRYFRILYKGRENLEVEKKRKKIIKN